MEYDQSEAIALLARTPATLDALLRGLPDAWTRSNEGEGTWSAFDVVAHLIHAERADWLPRARRILEFGESRPFDPFDRSGNIRESQDLPLGNLLDEFAQARARSLQELETLNLQQSDLQRRGQHPALGATTLTQHLATWAAHDLNHLHQISRIMANQYREAVGPWSRFLGVMQCHAHGA